MTVVLHVGLMKSGTTFVQQTLFAHRDRLASHDVLLPGRTWAAQVAHAKGALSGGDRASWDALAEQVRAHDGRSVVSVELLGPAEPGRRRRIVESLRPHRVEVVVTARDLNRSVVALWQETIQNGRTWTWADYLDGVRTVTTGEGRHESGRTFWRQMDLAGVTGGWAEVADRVSVVTVPPPGAPREVLLERFTEAAGLPGLDLVALTGNESLGLASTLALREVNERLDARGVAWKPSRAVRKRLLAKTVLAARKKVEPALGLAVPDWLAGAAADQVERTRALGPDLHGDWRDLTPVDVPGAIPEDVDPAAVRDAALAGLAGLVVDRARGR